MCGNMYWKLISVSLKKPVPNLFELLVSFFLEHCHLIVDLESGKLRAFLGTLQWKTQLPNLKTCVYLKLQLGSS